VKAILVLAILVALSLSLVPVEGVLADDEPEVVVGVLKYIPKPDVSICFCGSFRLAAAASGDWYLTSESIDLSGFDGARIMVFGRASSAICEGTLARSCSYLRVEKIVPVTSAGTAVVDWGLVKAIYR
jgi:hypothetical protein